MSEMFCFQCEQTAGCSACTGAAGVCGKTALVANDQDELTGALVALGQAVQQGHATEEAREVVVTGLFATVTNVDFSDAAVRTLIDRAHAATRAISTAGITDYDMNRMWTAN